MNSLAPIVLFVYNRPEHTLATLQSLKNNNLAADSVLFIYADGPKNNASEAEMEKINKTRNIIKQEQWCKEVFIIESETNKGLANSIVNGITEVVNKYGKIIVLEDDLLLSKGTLQYFNEALELYEKIEKVMHISAYMFPVSSSTTPETFFSRNGSCWGWATWKRAWKHYNSDAKSLLSKIKKYQWEFTMEGCYGDYFEQLELNAKGIKATWAIKWYASIFLNRGLCLYPSVSMIKNAGHDGSGTHCFANNVFFNSEIRDFTKVELQPVVEDKNGLVAIQVYLFNLYPSRKKLLIRYIGKIKNLLLPGSKLIR
jgi:hypothetical protein